MLFFFVISNYLTQSPTYIYLLFTKVNLHVPTLIFREHTQLLNFEEVIDIYPSFIFFPILQYYTGQYYILFILIML